MFEKQTEYAIRGLVYICLENMKGNRPGYKEISREINSPEHYMAKVLQILTKHNIIDSIRGRGGGFFFPSLDLSLPLLDIIRITEGEKIFSKCGFGLQGCDSQRPCPLHENYMPLREALYKLVKNITIQSLAKKIIDKNAVLNR